jgi:hypothetical protein
MRSLLRALLLCICAIAALCAEPYHPTCERKANALRIPAEDRARARAVRAQLDVIVFPNVTLTEISVPDAVKMVAQNAQRFTPKSVPQDRRTLSFVGSYRKNAEEIVTVNLHTATLPQVLDAICAPHDYVWSVDAYSLTISPREEF